MKLIEVLITTFFYLNAVSGRKLYDPKFENEDNNMDLEKPIRVHSSEHTRPRRESRNLYYNHYDPFGFDRHDFNQNSRSLQNKLLSDILQKLQELNSYLKTLQATPPQVPQHICVPVNYPVSQNPLPPINDIPNITFTTRGLGNIDPKRIWTIEKVKLVQGTDDGSRPINLDPVKTNVPTVRAPPVEHGSSQAGMTMTPAPRAKESDQCKGAILICCQRNSNGERKLCFSKYGCTEMYSIYKTHVCNPQIINLVIKEFINSYGPIR